ncbi:hypothetical protein SPSIL_032150 [Sporomusa silvacetica DSM 10669]|uniref:Ferritin-like domain-containing protein n=1 Tax=Sporomusa silvacetica DSM 10669 TaxID=1123289 RepID=A0ABZ3IMV9_9FIRM|nr:hypothetical protein [Sporomusa silvacetica]OZC18221.1 hypothetical protein SPSIL_27880 [Sporomusa silvacetica DSM 10669]
MKKIFSRRPLTVDPAHMITLHQEAIEQLELMSTVVEASEHASDGMRDTLTRMAENHWEAYLDVLHMICMHEESFAAVMKEHGFTTHDNESVDTEQRQFFGSRLLIMALLLGLIRRHRRFAYFYSLRANPMGDYIKESVAMEREHIVGMIGMVQNMM